jgi:hypothetical protein
MNDERSFERAARAWLELGANQAPDRAVQSVLLAIETTPQERDLRIPWRFPRMNKFVAIGLGTAAVVVALFVGTQLLGRPAPSGVGGAPSTAPPPTVEPSVAAPSSATYGYLSEGPFTIVDEGALNDPVRITVTIPASGWTSAPEFGGLSKGDDADPPEAAMLAWSWPAGTGFYVYGDPCHWASTTPDTPATTVDDIVAALAAQASRDASDPVDVTVGGYAGKQITLHVPNNAPTRAEAFADCDQDTFASYGTGSPGGEPSRYQQGPGQVDELWILDVDGAIVVLDAMYRPNTPTTLIEEMRAIAESAIFEAR